MSRTKPLHKKADQASVNGHRQSFKTYLDDLKKENIFLDQIIENLPSMIFLKEAKELRFVRFNKAGEDLLGHTKKNMIGKNDFDFFTKPEAQFFTKEDRRVLKSGKLRLIPEEPIHTKKKGVRTLRTKKVPLYDKRGRPAFLLGISEDITNEKKTLEALRNSEEKFRALVSSAPFNILVVNEKGKIQFINKTSLGYKVKDVLGKTIFNFIPRSSRIEVKRALAKSFKTGKFGTYDTDAFDTKGRKKTFSTWIGPIRENEKVSYVTLFSQDVTEIKEAEANLKIFQSLINQSSDSIFVVNPPDGKFLYVNRTVSDLLEWDEPTLLKMGVIDIDVLIPNLKAWKEVSRTIIRYGNLVLDGRLKKRDGSLVDVEISVRHLVVGKNEYLVALARDVSERKKLEKMVLEIGDQEKQRIGHDLHDDLGQELSAIALMGKVLQKNMEKTKNKQSEQMQNLVDMVKNCIDKTKLLSRGLSPVDLRSDGLLNGLEDLARRTEEVFQIPCRVNLDRKVLIDNANLALHLFRMAQEGVHNAVKHSMATRISIGLSRKGEIIELTVRDNGIGISKKSRLRKKGIGLSILEYRANVIGGHVSFYGPPRGGTVISCRVPLN